MRHLPSDFDLPPGPWYRILHGKHGIIIDPEPYDGPPCPVCQEPSGTHRTGVFFWDDDGRTMAGHACFAELDRILGGEQ